MRYENEKRNAKNSNRKRKTWKGIIFDSTARWKKNNIDKKTQLKNKNPRYNEGLPNRLEKISDNTKCVEDSKMVS